MTKKLAKGEKLVLATMNFAADTYLDDPSLEGVMLWGKMTKAMIQVEVNKEDEAARQLNLAKYAARGWAFEAPQQEETEDENEYAVEV